VDPAPWHHVVLAVHVAGAGFQARHADIPLCDVVEYASRVRGSRQGRVAQISRVIGVMSRQKVQPEIHVALPLPTGRLIDQCNDGAKRWGRRRGTSNKNEVRGTDYSNA